MSTLTIILIVLSALFLIIHLATERYGLALLWTVILALNITTGIAETKKEQQKNQERIHSETIYDIDGYKIDSTITINGLDTTKTYTISYWRYNYK